MKPVDQVQFYDPEVEGSRGDCLSACIASILEVPLEEVPIFTSDEDGPWDKKLVDWLVERDRTYLWVYPTSAGDPPVVWAPWNCPTVYAVASGWSPRSTKEHSFRHAVVWCFDHEGSRMAHDPHPSRDGIPKVEDFKLILPINQAVSS